MGLPDVDPLSQGGGFGTKYDTAYVAARDKNGVPFALLKAHALRESLQNAEALRVEPSGKASYGLMQILWWPNSSRFADWGYPDDQIGDGSLLYDPIINVDIASKIILDNWQSTGGNLRDTINMYNTGVKESRRKAPGNYVDDVIGNYNALIKGQVL
jgi:soluble lytic murein transglycosylase-like protein